MEAYSVKEQLKETLAHERVILRFYQELGDRLAGSEMGKACRAAAASAQERVDQLTAWLECRP